MSMQLAFCFPDLVVRLPEQRRPEVSRVAGRAPCLSSSVSPSRDPFSYKELERRILSLWDKLFRSTPDPMRLRYRRNPQFVYVPEAC
jgi:hypothetical protein